MRQIEHETNITPSACFFWGLSLLITGCHLVGQPPVNDEETDSSSKSAGDTESSIIIDSNNETDSDQDTENTDTGSITGTSSIADSQSTEDTGTNTEHDTGSDSQSTTCECAQGTCCDGCNYKPETTRCADEPDETESRCSSDQCGGDAETRSLYRYCTGASSVCGPDNTKWTAWTTSDDCGVDSLCKIVADTAKCQTCPGGCSAGQCQPECECTSGVCCDGCNFLPETEQCSLTPTDTQTRCSSTSCGGDVQTRKQYKYCTGENSVCNTSNLKWSPWSTTTDCASYCSEEHGNPHCVYCELGCDEGRCKGCWTDPSTGLMWTTEVHSYSEDYHYPIEEYLCVDLDVCGYTDWRLPNISELRMLIRGCPQTQSDGDCQVTETCSKESGCGYCEGCAMNEGPSSGCYLTTALGGACDINISSTYFEEEMGGLEIYYINFTNGEINHGTGTVGTSQYKEWEARCVRGGS